MRSAVGACRHAACRDCKQHPKVAVSKRRADCAPPLIADIKRYRPSTREHPPCTHAVHLYSSSPILLLLPWGLRNRRQSGEFYLTDSHGGKNRLTVNSALIAGKGVAGAGASYEVRIPRGNFKGGKNAYVETLLTSGARIPSDPASF